MAKEANELQSRDTGSISEHVTKYRMGRRRFLTLLAASSLPLSPVNAEAQTGASSQNTLGMFDTIAQFGGALGCFILSTTTFRFLNRNRFAEEPLFISGVLALGYAGMYPILFKNILTPTLRPIARKYEMLMTTLGAKEGNG